MQKRTKFSTIPLDQIQHLLEQAEILDAEDAVAMTAGKCLNCGHPASDHSIENDTCWHSTIRHGNATLCHCAGWRPATMAAN